MKTFSRSKTKFGWSLKQSLGDGRAQLVGYIERSETDALWRLRLFPPNGALDALRSRWPGITHFARVSEHRTISKAETEAEITRALWPAFIWRDARETDRTVDQIFAEERSK